MPTATGKMDKKVSIQKYTETSTAEGTPILTWAEENKMWARINPISGKERIEADRVEANITHRITMDFYSPGLTPKDRIVWNSRNFHITAVINVGELDCYTVVDVMEKV